jgi:hypothetical protein
VQVVSIAKLKPATIQPSGGTLGEAHWKQAHQIITHAGLATSDIVVLDFESIETATASYLKRLLNPLLSPEDPDAETALPSPVLVNVDSEDLREDIIDYLGGKRLALVEATLTKDKLKLTNVLGTMDGAAKETFSELCELKKATALQLYERHRERTTNQTAWNNRLFQLVQLRLARRIREGRFWIYEPTVTI